METAQHSLQTSVKPAIVTVGDELLFGERVNDNQKWLLRLLWERGYPAHMALSLPDDVHIIALWLRQLLSTDHYPILVSGGIGGTHDDLTREGIALALGVPLVKHPECYRILEGRYGNRFNTERQRMAWLPQGCELIANPIGAPGFHLRGIFAFPGFPTMLQSMVPEILDRIMPSAAPFQWITREYTLPLAEGDIAEAIETFNQGFPKARIGIYPDAQGRKEVTVRLRCSSDEPETFASFDTLVASLRKGNSEQGAGSSEQ